MGMVRTEESIDMSDLAADPWTILGSMDVVSESWRFSSIKVVLDTHKRGTWSALK